MVINTSENCEPLIKGHHRRRQIFHDVSVEKESSYIDVVKGRADDSVRQQNAGQYLQRKLLRTRERGTRR